MAYSAQKNGSVENFFLPNGHLGEKTHQDSLKT